eukprot:COSAG05_NODE_71_length_22071_cov_17.527149_15_plen_276_part_00
MQGLKLCQPAKTRRSDLPCWPASELLTSRPQSNRVGSRVDSHAPGPYREAVVGWLSSPRPAHILPGTSGEHSWLGPVRSLSSGDLHLLKAPSIIKHQAMIKARSRQRHRLLVISGTAVQPYRYSSALHAGVRIPVYRIISTRAWWLFYIASKDKQNAITISKQAEPLIRQLQLQHANAVYTSVCDITRHRHHSRSHHRHRHHRHHHRRHQPLPQSQISSGGPLHHHHHLRGAQIGPIARRTLVTVPAVALAMRHSSRLRTGNHQLQLYAHSRHSR